MTAMRDLEEMNDVVAWAENRIDNGESYHGMSYEEGIRNALLWASGQSDERPDSEE